VYLASIIGLLLLLARPVYLVFSASEQRGAESVAQGISNVVDSLTQGSSVVCTLPAYPGVSLSVDLSGSAVSAYVDGNRASTSVRWPINPMTMEAGESYSFTLEDGHVLVSAVSGSK
jgi:hypothetical protein